MTQLWKENTVIPVTVIKAEPNKITLLRTKNKDGYDAVQVALGKEKHEGRVADTSAFKVGDEITVASFIEGDVVKASGTSKGRGFQGVVKRHGFGGGPKTHGQKNRWRAAGSIGSTAPQRVTPGRRMAGHMGSARVTVKNLKIVSIDRERNLILVRGAVPGAPGGLVEIRK